MKSVAGSISIGLRLVEKWWTRPPGAAGQRTGWLWKAWLVVTLTVAGLAGLTGCAPIWAALNDYIVLMDGAWRMHNGQIPHTDFYSVLGHLPLATLRLAFAVFGPSPNSLPKAMVCVGIFFSLITFVLAKSRLSPAWALMLSVAVLACAAAPVPLGVGGGPPFGFRHLTTYAMFYNRLGWACFIPALLVVLLPRLDNRHLSLAMGESFILGFCLVSVASVKLNFAVGAVALLIWAVFFHWRKWEFWAGLVGGSLFMLMCYFCVLGNVTGYLTDTLTLLQVKRPESHWEQLTIRVHENRLALLALALALVWIWYNQRSRSKLASEVADQDYLFIGGLYATGLSVFITTFNWERAEVPGLMVVATITLVAAQKNYPATLSGDQDPGHLVRLGIMKGLATLLVSSYLIFDLGALAYSFIWKTSNAAWASRCEQIDGAFFQSLPVPLRWDEKPDASFMNQSIHDRPVVDFPARMMTSGQFTRWINDGADLLRPHVQPSDRIFVADWLNPYNLVFGLPPASGGALLWDYRRMLDEEHHPDVDKTMAEVTLIMVPKVPHLPAQSRFMVKTYANELVDDRLKVGESRFWTLFQTEARRSRN